MAVKRRKDGARRTFVAAIAVFTAIMLALPAAALALPAETPDNTPMVEGRVRAIEQVDSNIWLGGQFSQVNRCAGITPPSVENVAVLNSQTNECRNIAPDLGGVGTEVWDIQRYGTTNNLLIAGTFNDPTNVTHENLVLVNGK